MLTNKNGAPFEQVAPSKNNLKASAFILHFPLKNRKPCCRAPWWITCECEQFFSIAARQRARKVELRGARR